MLIQNHVYNIKNITAKVIEICLEISHLAVFIARIRSCSHAAVEF